MKRNRWLLPLLLLVQTLFAGTTFRTMPVVLVAFLFFEWIAYRGRSRGRRGVATKRSGAMISSAFLWAMTLFGITVVLSIWRLSNHFGDGFNPVAYFVDAFAHVSLIFGMLFHVRRPVFGHPAMLGLGLLVMMLSMASGAASQSLTAQITIALLSCVAFLFASRFILHAWYLEQRSSQSGPSDPKKLLSRSSSDGYQLRSLHGERELSEDRLRIGWLFTAVTLSVLLMVTSLFANFTGTVLPEVQRIVHDSLKSSFDAVDPNVSLGSSHYVRGDRLGSLRRVMMVNPTEVALRAQADSRPGYLRGSVFDFYRSGRWEEIENGEFQDNQALASFRSRAIPATGIGTTPLIGSATNRLRRFNVSNLPNQAIATVQIENVPSKGYVFFSPLATKWVEAKGNRIRVNSHGVVESGINAQYPYIAGVGAQSDVDAMDSKRRDILTFVDKSMRDVVSDLATRVCRGQVTNVSKAVAISSHFQSEYDYSLRGVPVPGRGDPLAYFIETKHPAHCELFASATVLMLRSVDVPARYVTGYVAEEYSDEEESWVARNKDAHAWAEAYDNVTETWFGVESTPGRSYATLTLGGENQALLANSSNMLEDAQTENDSMISRFFGWVLSNRATDPLSILIRFAQGPVFLLGIFLLWRRLRGGRNTGLSEDDMKSRKMLAIVDRRISKFSLHRSVGETMHQFAQRIERESVDVDSVGRLRSQSVKRYATWYREFAEARYQGLLPRPYAEA